MGVSIFLADAGFVAGGGYTSLLKVIPVMVLLLVWVRLLSWADKDAGDNYLPRVKLNASFLGGLVAAFAVFFLLPSFWIAFPVLLLAFCIEAGVYLQMRKDKVGLADLAEKFTAWSHGFNKEKEEKVEATTLVLLDKAGQAIPLPKKEAPERVTYDAGIRALTEPLTKGAERIDVAPGDTGYVVRYQVDGVPYQGATLDPDPGAAAISWLKGIAGMDVEDRRKPQTGAIKGRIDKTKYDLKIRTEGTRAGEYLRADIVTKNKQEFKLDTLGFSERQLELVRESIKDNTGIVLLSAPRSQGLTSMMYGIIRSHDAFLTHIHSIERDADQDLEGITQNKLPGNATGSDELKLVDWIISQEPDVMLVSKVEDVRSAASLINFASAGKRVYVGLRASSTIEALEQWRKFIGDDKLALSALKLVINGRVLRKLCLACKVGYTPDPATLRKLNMNPDKVSTLFQARTEPVRDAKGNAVPCTFCHDLRFKGRVGIFETLVADDDIRAAVGAGKSPNQAFRKQRGKYLQEEALALVEKGDTSVQEVLRVLRSAGESRPAAAAPRAGSQGAAVAPKR